MPVVNKPLISLPPVNRVLQLANSFHCLPQSEGKILQSGSTGVSGSEIVLVPETHQWVELSHVVLVSNVVEVHLNLGMPSHSVHVVPLPVIKVTVIVDPPSVTTVKFLLSQSPPKLDWATNIFLT
jgi:hypothetical protein